MTGRDSRGKATTARRSEWFRTTIIVVSTICAIALFLVIGATTAQPAGSDPLAAIEGIGAALSLLIVGAVLVSRLPRNPISWMLWAAGLSFAINSAASGLAQVGLNVNQGSVPGAVWLAWLNTWVGQMPLGLIVLVPLLYPTGRLPSKR